MQNTSEDGAYPQFGYKYTIDCCFGCQFGSFNVVDVKTVQVFVELYLSMNVYGHEAGKAVLGVGQVRIMGGKGKKDGIERSLLHQS